MVLVPCTVVATVRASWLRLRLYGGGSEAFALVVVLALMPAEQYELHAHEFDAFRVDVPEGAQGFAELVHVVPQLVALASQMLKHFLRHQNSPVSGCCSEPPWFCGCILSVMAVTASTDTPNSLAISCGGLPAAFSWLTFITSTCGCCSCTP